MNSKKVLALGMAAVMAAGMTGCSVPGEGGSTTAGSSTGTTAAAAADESAQGGETAAADNNTTCWRTAVPIRAGATRLCRM